jgi:predicted XRE-type DNA-binding protein
MKEQITSSSVEVNFDEIKNKLSKTIARLINQKKLKQREVEVILDIKQPRVSDLVNGKVEKFSIDSLLDYLNKIGYVIEGYPVNQKEYIDSIKTRLITIVGEIIESNKFKQRQVQELLAIKQPRVSDLVNKKIEKFSVDSLIEYLTKLGYSFEVNVMESVKTPMTLQFKTVNKSIKKPKMPKRVMKEHRVVKE